MWLNDLIFISRIFLKRYCNAEKAKREGGICRIVSNENHTQISRIMECFQLYEPLLSKLNTASEKSKFTTSKAWAFHNKLKDMCKEENVTVPIDEMLPENKEHFTCVIDNIASSILRNIDGGTIMLTKDSAINPKKFDSKICDITNEEEEELQREHLHRRILAVGDYWGY